MMGHLDPRLNHNPSTEYPLVTRQKNKGERILRPCAKVFLIFNNVSATSLESFGWIVEIRSIIHCLGNGLCVGGSPHS